MKEDFSELIEYLDKKFTGIDERFNSVGEKLANIDRQLDDLKENKADKEDVNNLLNAVDAYAKRADAFFQELVALSHKVDRHEKWIRQIAEKLDVKLKE